MMRASMVFSGEHAGDVARSLDPDNLPDMELVLSVVEEEEEGEDREFRVEFSVEKIGTLLATADDLLMNIKIAEDVLKREDG
ncbi:MAG: KEOPS complex subunit Pcc1 [Euryarchaeota archaeon]|nr:KEOPS complex subunit Pcc1 [Euryarchaeota archaeon]